MPNPEPKTGHLVRYQWQKGTSGNPEGGRRGRPNLTAILANVLAGTTLCGEEAPDGRTVAQTLVEAMLRHAIKGDPQMLREIMRRIDGPPPKSAPQDDGIAQLSDADLIARIKGLAGGSGAPRADDGRPDDAVVPGVRGEGQAPV